MYRDATATRASKTPESISDSELISHLIDSQVFDNVPSGRINSGNEQAAPLDPDIPIKPQGVVVFQ
jgi:hypothetical protein